MATSCFHCNEAVPPGTDLFVTFDNVSQPVCCAGCQAVAEMILDDGFAAYYKHRDEPAIRPDEHRFDWAIFDDAAFQKDFCRQIEDGTTRVDLLVEGITCSACAWLIEKRLSQTQGAANSQVITASHRLRFTWDPSRSKLSTILQALSALGYRVRPWNEENAAEHFAVELRSLLFKVGLAGIAFLQVMMFAVALYAGEMSGIDDSHRSLMRWFSLAISIPVVFYSAEPFFSGAYRALKGRSLTMEVPVAIAISLAWGASIVATFTNSGEVYFDSVVMFVFFLLSGRYLEHRAQHRERQTLFSLAAWLPSSALRFVDGGFQWVPTMAIREGDLLQVLKGETAPADGVLSSDSAHMDESLLTGEHLAVRKHPGDRVFAGTINTGESFSYRMDTPTEQSQAAKINELLGAAANEKPPITQLVDRIAGGFIASVLIIAAASYWYWSVSAPQDAFWIALSVLVVTCPCALSLATPVAITSSILGFKKQGVLVTQARSLQALDRVDTIFLDKTGTLTTGELRVASAEILSSVFTQDLVLDIAAALERESSHPIASAFNTRPTNISPDNLEVIIGEGVRAQVDGQEWRIGKPSFCDPAATSEPVVALSCNHSLVAKFTITDTLRDGIFNDISKLKAQGIEVLLVSGDHQDTVASVAKAAGIDTFFSAQKPEDKYRLLQQYRGEGRRVLMVGDGLNDVPVIGGADVSVAMSSGAALARCHADVVLNASKGFGLAGLLRNARRLNITIKQNLGWALLYNLVALPLAVMGFVPPWAAAVGMSLSSLIVVLNALKLSR
ncbi:heavy metal translocating P-type ATPase [Umboniibacter marinipuniceus]|uniref:Cu2+-exporting ATPase n=1 Tax=Umboniibacter marinipuniceus TaxID=569599 RepID=A0A3M0AF65_9GAMM|nr:heavy metal translocating P-type ATPase [Umboniibacter marinipuniceus]RMA81398.1 Cu2+-exporting ATPase [Umboniibacter marinipuniceus]